MAAEPQYPSLIDHLARLKQPREGDYYYAITLTVVDDGRLLTQTHMTEFVGWHDEDRRIEVRRPGRVVARFAEVAWASRGQPYIVVNEEDDLPIFLLVGGNGLIAEGIVKARMPEFLLPHPSVYDVPVGFLHLGSCSPSDLRRAPTPKLRMEVLRRDARRCRICGRRPDDHVDVELHVHHIRPWAEGGLTEPQNLITLCHTCHNGLAPHFDGSLYEYVLSERSIPRSRRDREALDELTKGVERYRQLIQRLTLQDEPP